MVEPPGDGEVAGPSTWFEGNEPFELEIGSGKGGFLLARARAHPEVRLLGIEWANKYYRYAADRMARWNVRNVRVMRTDAKLFVIHHLAPDSLSALHVYHPDPWPKKRHHKRRLIQPDFAEAAIRAIVPGGAWLVQTDHADYWEQMEEVLSAQSVLERREWGDDDWGAGPEWGGTNYEIKYAKEGRSIYRAVYRVRKADAGPAR